MISGKNKEEVVGQRSSQDADGVRQTGDDHDDEDDHDDDNVSDVYNVYDYSGEHNLLLAGRLLAPGKGAISPAQGSQPGGMSFITNMFVF